MLYRTLTVAMIVVIGSTGMAWAESETAALRDEVQQLKDLVQRQQVQIADLQSAQNQTWMTEARAEQVKTLIREVLADAEMRASLLDQDLTAGWNENFFLASADGKFLLKLSGLIQVRYIYNYFDDVDEGDDYDNSEGGFQNRRSRIRLEGHVGAPNIRYAIQHNFIFEENNNDGNINGPGTEDDTSGFGFLEEAWIAYDFDNGWSLQAGQFKGPFAREELVDAGYQLTVERSYVTDYFTLDFVQGVQLFWAGELGEYPTHFAVMIHDGSYSSAINWNQELTDIAIAARGEMLLIGNDWAQTRDFTTFSNQSELLLVGAAIDWQLSESGEGANEQDDAAHVKFTLDLSYERPDWQNFNFFVAYYGQYIYENTDFEHFDSSLDDSYYQQGVVVQAGVHVVPDKWEVFARYEYFDTDGVIYYQSPEDSADRTFFTLSDDDDQEYNIVTLGVNYFIQRHRTKATLDFMYVLDQVAEANTGAGIEDYQNDDGDASQFVIRAQLQLLF